MPSILDQVDQATAKLENQGLLNYNQFMAPSVSAPLDYLQNIVDQKKKKQADEQANKELAQYGAATPEVASLLSGTFNPVPAVPASQMSPMQLNQVGQAPLPKVQAIAPAAKPQPIADVLPEISFKPAPGMKKALKEGQKAQVEGYKAAQAQIGAQQAQAQAQASELDQAQAELKKTQALKQKAMQEANEKSRLADEELSKIEPKDFWADKSTGSKIAAGIAMGVGAYASAINGGPNTALNIINSAIQDDLNLQKEKYQRAKERGASIKSYYGNLVAQLGDQEAADNAFVGYAYKNIDNKFKQAEQNSRDDLQKAQIRNINSEISQRYQTMQAQKESILAQQAMQKALQSGGEINPEALPKEERERYVKDSEFSGPARTREEAIKFRESLPKYKGVQTALKRLYDISNTAGRTMSTETRAEAEQLRKLLVGDLREDVLGPGTVQESERNLILNDVLGDPTSLMSLDSSDKVKLKNLASKLQTQKADQARAIGLTTSVKPSQMNEVYIKVNGQAYKIPAANLEQAKQKAQKSGVKFEVM